MNEEIVDEGMWCKVCLFFEEPSINNGRCEACGCSADVHIEARVVAVTGSES